MKIAEDWFPNIDEVAQIGPFSLQVWTKKHAVFRVHAMEYLRGGPDYNFVATFDEQTAVYFEGQDKPLSVWTKSNIAEAHGDTVDHCLMQALSFLNNLALSRDAGAHKKQ